MAIATYDRRWQNMNPSGRFKVQKNDRGYTLIELLLTIAIIGLLSAIAIPTYLSQRDKAKYAEIKVMLRAVYTEATIYRAEYGKYPADTQPGEVPKMPNGTPAFVNFRLAEDNPFGERMDWDLLPDKANPGQWVAKIMDTGADDRRQDDYTTAGGAPGVPYRTVDDTAIVVGEEKPAP